MTTTTTSPITDETTQDREVTEFLNALPAWRKVISGNGQLDDTTLTTLATGMSSQLACRDAILLTVISNLNIKSLSLTVTEYSTYAAKTLVSTTLHRVFNDPSLTPNTHRTENAMTLLTHMQTLTSSAQPTATLSYLQWWTGDTQGAQQSAEQALSLDNTTTLAQIVLAAIEHQIQPAYLN